MYQMAKLEGTINFMRDVLRKEGITGMDSINHCIVFLMCRMLNEELCKKVNIDKKFAFENLTKDDNGEMIGNQELYAKIYRKKSGSECLIGELVNKLQFKNIKFKMEGIQNLRSIIDKLENLDVHKLSTKYDLIGTIYEIHLKSGTSNAMRDLGQYYTNRLVIKYMIELCDPKMIDGKIEKIVDPTMGTGGFLTMSIKYLNEKYKKIKWNRNKDNIIGFDIDDNVRNMALMNVFLEIGELCTDSLVKQDTLHNDMKFQNGTILEKADVILANEPMGLKNIIHAECCERIKDLKLRGTKSEPLFLQLFMEALDDGGRCAVIVPIGMLFNDSNQHIGTRKYLLENFSLKKIVSLKDKFFLNTGGDMSILFFENNGYQTSKVEFSEIKLKDGEIVETSIIKVKMSEIEKNKYSLFINNYKIEEIENIKGVEYKKFHEICKFIGGKHSTSFGKPTGKYKFHTGGVRTDLYVDKYDIDKLSIIINRTNGSGKCNIFLDKNFSSATQTLVFTADNDISTKYIYYYFYSNIYKLEQGYKGSDHKNITTEFVENIEIPYPALDIQNKIVERFDAIKNSIKNRGIEYKKIMRKYMMLLMCGDTLNEEYVTICKLLDLEKKLCNDDEKIKQIIKTII